jgi:hypothetical protein
MNRTPDRDEFERELAAVIRQRLAEHYGRAYDLPLLLAMSCCTLVTGFLLGVLVWTYLP